MNKKNYYELQMARINLQYNNPQTESIKRQYNDSQIERINWQ